MKETVKIIKFDIQTLGTSLLISYAVLAVICGLLSLFLAPSVCSYIVFLCFILITPLHGISEKNNFKKLYGVLPVGRKSIVRGRFWYIYLFFLVTEILEFAIGAASHALELHKLVPFHDRSWHSFIEDAFADKMYTFDMIIILFVLLSIIFLFFEMTGQIFGWENEFKVMGVTALAFFILLFGYLELSDNYEKIDILGFLNNGFALKAAAANAVVLAVNILFCEITAKKVSTREL